MTSEPFKVGDIVSRDGTDEHLVYEADTEGYGMIGVVCIKEPNHAPGKTPWTRVGETERNLTRRYEIVRRAAYTDEGLSLLDAIHRLSMQVQESGGSPDCVVIAEELAEQLKEEMASKAMIPVESIYEFETVDGLRVYRKKDAPAGMIYVGRAEDLVPEREP